MKASIVISYEKNYNNWYESILYFNSISGKNIKTIEKFVDDFNKKLNSKSNSITLYLSMPA